MMVCSTMLGNRFWGCESECQSGDSFVFFFWCETHTKGLHVRLPTRSEENEGRQGTRVENRWRQSTEERSQREVEPVDPKAGFVNVRGWVSVPGDCVGISFGYMLTIAHICTESYTKVSQTSPFLRLELTQIRACWFFFSSTLSVVYVVSCVFIKKCEIPQAGDERNHWMIGWPWGGLGGWDSEDQPAGILSQMLKL